MNRFSIRTNLPYGEVPIGAYFEHGALWYRLVELPAEQDLPPFKIGYMVADQQNPFNGDWSDRGGVALSREQVVGIA